MSSQPPGSGAAAPGESPITRLGGEPPSPFEARWGYSRVVAAGPFVFVSGTTSIDPTGCVVGSTPYEQAVAILGKLTHELARAGLSLADAVQTRIYVTDISRGDEVGRAHAEAFGGAGPAAAMVEVTGLADPRMLVEIELVAYRP